MFHTLQAPLDFGIKVGLVIVVICECGVNLSKREVRMLEMDLLGAPAMCDLIQRNLDRLGSGVVDPREAAVIEPDMSVGYYWHTQVTVLYETMRLIQRRKFSVGAATATPIEEGM